MKIENTNYSYNVAYLKSAAGKNKLNDIQKSSDDFSNQVKNLDSGKSDISMKNENQNVLSGSEKDFFVNLFPQSESEIKQYSIYDSDGSRKKTDLGTIFDRKG